MLEKCQFKMVKEFNVLSEMLKLLEANIQETHQNI
jgi:hypothetical protein